MSESILVIDDDETFNAVLVNALRRRGLDAHGCTDPATALAVAARQKPARVVLDLDDADRLQPGDILVTQPAQHHPPGRHRP